jgi:hypothetical protein
VCRRFSGSADAFLLQLLLQHLDLHIEVQHVRLAQALSLAADWLYNNPNRCFGLGLEDLET